MGIYQRPGNIFPMIASILPLFRSIFTMYGCRSRYLVSTWMMVLLLVPGFKYIKQEGFRKIPYASIAAIPGRIFVFYRRISHKV